MFTHWSQFVPKMSTRHPRTLSSTSSPDDAYHWARHSSVSRFGLAVRRYAGKRKDLGSIPFRPSFLFKKLVCGYCLVTLSLTITETIDGSHRCPSESRSHSGGDRVATGIFFPLLPPSLVLPRPLPPSSRPY